MSRNQGPPLVRAVNVIAWCRLHPGSVAAMLAHL